MSPPAGASLFRRFFGLVENYPLYLMVGIAGGLSVYTPIRHLQTASDITLDRNQRDYMDGLGSSPRVLARGKQYEGGILGYMASFNNWPSLYTPKGTDPENHFHHERWPANRPFEVPQAPSS